MPIRRLTLEEFIIRAQEKHGNRFNYIELIRKGGKTYIIYICKDCNTKAEQTVQNHLRGKGCNMCSGCFRWDTESFVEKSREIHENKYSYIFFEYINSKTPDIIVCNTCNFMFEQYPAHHLMGAGCRNCAMNKLHDSCRISQEEFISRSKELFKDKFGYQYVKYVNYTTEICLYCNDCKNIFNVTPAPHLNPNCNGRCKVCQKNNAIKLFKYTKDEFIQKSIEYHGIEKFDWTNFEYDGMTKFTVFKCNSCFTDFETTPSTHLNSSGCPECMRRSRCRSLEHFIEQANIIHNSSYDYSLIENMYNFDKVPIKCKKCCLIWQQSPAGHLSGRGCPDCGKKSYISKPEKEWLNSLNIDSLIRQKRIKLSNKHALVDAYDPNTNTIYEFNGDYWHGNPRKYDKDDINIIANKTYGEIYDNTIKREKELSRLGYNIISMWEMDWKKLKCKKQI